LGYDLEDRNLVVSPEEANRVKEICGGDCADFFLEAGWRFCRGFWQKRVVDDGFSMEFVVESW
jgi:hypothetical protein